LRTFSVENFQNEAHLPRYCNCLPISIADSADPALVPAVK